jgi:hypothetical protein
MNWITTLALCWIILGLTYYIFLTKDEPDVVDAIIGGPIVWMAYLLTVFRNKD